MSAFTSLTASTVPWLSESMEVTVLLTTHSTHGRSKCLRKRANEYGSTHATQPTLASLTKHNKPRQRDSARGGCADYLTACADDELSPGRRVIHR